MSQIHRRFTDEQVKVLFEGCCQGQLARTVLQDLLGIGKSRFFALLKAYRRDPEGFTIAYRRPTPAKLSSEVEDAIVDDNELGMDADTASLEPGHVRVIDAEAIVGVGLLQTADQARAQDVAAPDVLRAMLPGHDFSFFGTLL